MSYDNFAYTEIKLIFEHGDEKKSSDYSKEVQTITSFKSFFQDTFIRRTQKNVAIYFHPGHAIHRQRQPIHVSVHYVIC